MHALRISKARPEHRGIRGPDCNRNRTRRSICTVNIVEFKVIDSVRGRRFFDEGIVRNAKVLNCTESKVEIEMVLLDPGTKIEFITFKS